MLTESDKLSLIYMLEQNEILAVAEYRTLTNCEPRKAWDHMLSFAREHGIKAPLLERNAANMSMRALVA